MVTHNPETLPWVEKYRPHTLSGVKSHEPIIHAIKQMLSKGELPHMLLHGPPGTGKTTTIMAICKEIFGPSRYKSMILELNASDECGIDVVRERIKSFASTSKLFFPTLKKPTTSSTSPESSNPLDTSQTTIHPSLAEMKIVILDEADYLASNAQFALRRIMEKYSKHTRFFLMCNYVSKIIPAIQSRCARFRFKPLPVSSLRSVLDVVVKNESIRISPGGCEALLHQAEQDMRKMLNVLQSVSVFVCGDKKGEGEKEEEEEGEVTAEDVYRTSGVLSPTRTKVIYNSLLTAHSRYGSDAVVENKKMLEDLVFTESIAPSSLISALADITVGETGLPKGNKAKLLSEISNIELAIGGGGNVRIQLGALAGAYVLAGMIPK
ncbi:replication factor C subunit 3 [Aduncisulcus paluster]|uniref:Replication factor C subunit 3 n=1 Tax=Aduncisulcus paluster TaxID=2918883 RepID=A0ABQ5JZB7_9EUKA|nr:replication factor C subunit 3 [Aduncisulcus paluster]